MKSRIASTKAEIRREEGSTSLLHSPDSSPLSKVVLLVCMTLLMKLFLTGFRFVFPTASFFFPATSSSVSLKSCRKDEKASSWTGKFSSCGNSTVYVDSKLSLISARDQRASKKRAHVSLGGRARRDATRGGGGENNFGDFLAEIISSNCIAY